MRQYGAGLGVLVSQHKARPVLTHCQPGTLLAVLILSSTDRFCPRLINLFTSTRLLFVVLITLSLKVFFQGLSELGEKSCYFIFKRLHNLKDTVGNKVENRIAYNEQQYMV
jgi:hypothetical protein